MAPLARKPSIWEGPSPSSRKTSSVCSPNPGATRGATFGASLIVTGLFTVYRVAAPPSSIGTMMSLARNCGSFDLVGDLHHAVGQPGRVERLFPVHQRLRAEHAVELGHERRGVNAAALVAELDRVFGAQPLVHWKKTLDAARLPYGVVQVPDEIEGPAVPGQRHHRADRRRRRGDPVHREQPGDDQGSPEGRAPGRAGVGRTHGGGLAGTRARPFPDRRLAGQRRHPEGQGAGGGKLDRLAAQHGVERQDNHDANKHSPTSCLHPHAYEVGGVSDLRI